MRDGGVCSRLRVAPFLLCFLPCDELLIIFVILAGGGLANAAAAKVTAWQEGCADACANSCAAANAAYAHTSARACSTQNPAPPAAPVHTGPVIVINPAHGGTDEGARADNGLRGKKRGADIRADAAKRIRAARISRGDDAE